MKKRKVKPICVVDHEITIPGSKSYTARALVIAALASGESYLKNPLLSEDTEYMIRGLHILGADIKKLNGDLLVSGTAGKFSPAAQAVYLGGAGTAVRFLTTLCGLSSRPIIIDGDSRMRERPIQDLLEALGPLGIKARSIHGNGCPPVLIEPDRFEGGRTQLRGGKSSQFLSSILLCSPYARREVAVEIADELVSRSYVDLTVQAMEAFGVTVKEKEGVLFEVHPGRYLGREYSIEADLSSASYFLASAAITGGRILIKGVNPSSKQGDLNFIDILQSMGCYVRWKGQQVEVIGRELHGVEVNMKRMPDTVQTLAIVAAFAKGVTRISHVNHLQFKETDRLAALTRELAKMGVEASQEDQTLVIKGGDPKGAEIETYRDHRMAMAFAVAGLRAAGMVIRDPDCVNKSMPTFWQTLERLG